MNNKTLVAAAAVAVAVSVPAIKNALHTRRVERAKREQIELNLQKDLAALRLASDKVHENIQNGVYRNCVGFGITELMNDFEFYRMTSHKD